MILNITGHFSCLRNGESFLLVMVRTAKQANAPITENDQRPKKGDTITVWITPHNTKEKNVGNTHLLEPPNLMNKRYTKYAIPGFQTCQNR
jgi:hypothetical protein